MSRNQSLFLSFAIILFITSATAFAGEDVQLYDMSGSALKPSQLYTVNSRKTCGDCHEFDDRAKSIHFNRQDKEADINSADCLSCHLTAKNAFNADGTIKKTIMIPSNASCLSCHPIAKSSIGTHSTHSKMSCYDCHKSAGHKNVAAVSCAGCHTMNAGFSGAIRERHIKPLSGYIFLFIIALSIVHYAIFGPRRVKTPINDPEIQRFTPWERIIHMFAFLSFVFLAISGAVFLFRADTPTGSLRAIHTHVGPLFLIAVIGIVIIWWRNGLFVSCDKDWVCKIGGYLWIRGDCPAEKFNAGQKIFFWLIAAAGGLSISITGILLALGKDHASSLVYTLHDLLAVIMTSSIMGHAYLSIFANPGTIKSMLTGRVPKSWAKRHHPNWYKRHENDPD